MSCFAVFEGCKQKNWFKTPGETSPSCAGWKDLCTLLAYKSQLVFITAAQAWWLVPALGPHHQLQPPSAEPSPMQYLGCLFFSLRVQLRACPLPNCLLFPPGGFSKLSRFWILTLFSRKFSALLTSVSFASVMRFHSRNIPTVHHFWGGPLRTVCLWHWALQQPMPGISPGRNPRATTQCAGWGRWGYRANMLCLQWAVAFCHSTITKIIQISCLAAIQPSMREKTHR